MSIVLRAICWAAVIVLAALAARFEIIGESAASTMLLVLPILAVLTLYRRASLVRRCRE